MLRLHRLRILDLLTPLREGLVAQPVGGQKSCKAARSNADAVDLEHYLQHTMQRNLNSAEGVAESIEGTQLERQVDTVRTELHNI